MSRLLPICSLSVFNASAIPSVFTDVYPEFSRVSICSRFEFSVDWSSANPGSLILYGLTLFRIDCSGDDVLKIVAPSTLRGRLLSFKFSYGTEGIFTSCIKTLLLWESDSGALKTNSFD